MITAEQIREVARREGWVESYPRDAQEPSFHMPRHGELVLVVWSGYLNTDGAMALLDKLWDRRRHITKGDDGFKVWGAPNRLGHMECVLEKVPDRNEAIVLAYLAAFAQPEGG